MKKVLLRRSTSLFFIAILISSLASAADYYAAPGGNGNGSIGSPWSLGTALASGAGPGDTIWLRGGTYYGSYSSYLTGSSTSAVIVRQYPGERAIIDGSTSPDTAALTINGSYAWYWGFEITNSNPTRILETPGSVGRAFGVIVNGPNTKAINLVVHDTGQGFSFWTPAANSELYGNIVYYNGWEGPDRGHGHGIYVQNLTGAKLMTDNIVFDQFGFGFHAYAEGGSINNLTFDGNMAFNNGSASSGGYSNNIYVQANNVAQNPVVNNNATYYTPAEGDGYNTVGNCSNANINNNYFVSGYFAISLPNCAPTTMAGNTFIGWTPGWIAGAYPNNSWSATGLRAIVRPNRYEPGRANIAIFNWDHLPSVNVDISLAGLAIGQSYELRDAQNFLSAPLATGTYSGAPISVPMAGLPKAPPIGSVSVIPPHTSSEFGVFVVLPAGSAPPGGDTVPPSVAITAPAPGANVSGDLAITATASDNIGVAGVQFQIDGANHGSEIGASPYSTVVDSTNLTNAGHTLTAIARDASNNRTTSAPVSISVSNLNGPVPFVTAYNLNNAPVRNGFSGWVGMRLTMGSDPIGVTSLGRICLSGNTGAHTVKLVRASDGMDVPGGSASVGMAGCIGGQFKYAALGGPVTLQAGATYYLVTQETNGGDGWYDLAPLTTTSIATVTSSVYSSGANWVPFGAPGTSYVPPTFKYVPVGDSTPPAVSISAPIGGANVSGTVGISANASDNVGVAGVQFKIDASANIGAEQTTPPFQAVLDTTTVLNGQHQLTAVARDAAGNTTTSVAVAVNVSNSAGAGPAPFLTGYNLNGRPLRNNYSGWVGMKFTVGATPVNVSSLGRIYVAGNSGTHIVKLVRASDGADVAGGSVSISMTGGTAGQFKYAALSTVVSLSANTSYYLASQEAAGGDQWHDFGTVSSTADAAVNSAVYSGGSTWITIGTANSSYVPANFLYLPGAAPPPTVPFITGFNTGSNLRNDFTGWVGTKFTVGANGMTVYSLGRILVAGNSGSHIVKLVRASDGSDVPGASTTVALAGTPGQFVYAALPAGVALPAGTAYYLVSYEVAGGDRWYDTGAVSTTTDAAVNSSVYFGGSMWIPLNAANTSYVPVNLRYVAGAGSADTSFVKTYNLNNRPLRNDFSGWVGMKFTVGASDVTISALGRLFTPGSSGNHIVKLVRASDGTNVPGASVSVPMAGGTAGQFSFATLGSPITLQANTAYYLASQELLGGDQWYDHGTVTTSSAGAVNSAVYSYDGATWLTIAGPNTSYVPPNFK